jgi:2-haloacid dehalogenase/putative hydrolase of the HAD superfamily
MLKPQALLLDFYGTLVREDDDEVAAICAAAAQSADLPVSAAGFSDYWWERFCALADESYGPAFRLQRDLARLSLTATLQRFRCAADADSLLAGQFAYWQRPELYPDTTDLLATSLPLCLVSDIDRADLTAALTHQGLAGRIAGVVTSEDARAYKPRPEPFTAALAILGLTPNDVMHVGDSLTRDVTGAASLRIPAVWVNRTGKAARHDAESPELTVTSLTELAGLLT